MLYYIQGQRDLLLMGTFETIESEVAKDPTESNDLAAEEPERLNLLRKKLMQITEQGNSK